MSEKELEKQIEKLKQAAMIAYNKKDYVEEARLDEEIKRLIERRDREFPVTPLTEADLIRHSWNQEDLRKYGGQVRCSKCGRKQIDYIDGIAKLLSWPEEEKRTRAYNSAMMIYSCKKISS